MAGNYRSGRRPANQPEASDPSDTPKKPAGLSEEASAFWDQFIVPAKHLRRGDSAMAQACCEAWDLYRKTQLVASQDPLDKDTRIAVNQYCATWKSLMERLALDPLGRARAAAGVAKTDNNDPLGEFGIVG